LIEAQNTQPQPLILHILESILSEQKLSLSGIVNPEQATDTGKIAGVKQMVIGSVGKLGLAIVLNARVVDTESGQVLSGWSLTGSQEADLSKMAIDLAFHISGVELRTSSQSNQSETIAPSAPDRENPATGFWVSEWYDSEGKHPGSIYIMQNGSEVTGWTVEDIGPARLSARMDKLSMNGKYRADYGEGKFEFTLSPDHQRLIGSYEGSNGSNGTWMAWRRTQVVAHPVLNSRALADWSGDIWTYPGTVVKIEGDRYLIQYDDGDSEWLVKDRVYPMDLRSGDIVYVAQSNKRGYTYATIVQIESERAFVEYKDGERKWEPIGRMRLLRVRKTGY